MSSVQTDNSYIADKVMMRLRHLPDKPAITVLDAFAGDGTIWRQVRKMSDKQITVVSLDQKPDKSGVYLQGDNIKFMAGMDLTRFDIIDLDAYGVPYDQLCLMTERAAKGTVVFVTFIQSSGPTGGGGLPHKMLVECGFSPSMAKKCQMMINRNGMEKMKCVLYQRGIRRIHIRESGRKHYFCFVL
jgi:hypothetical protein